jgi:endo-1,4-beta-xylanase
MMRLRTDLLLVLLACVGIFIMCCTDPNKTGNGNNGDNDNKGGPIAVTGFTLEKETLTLTMFAKEKLNFTITPPNATNKNITWTSGTPAVVSVSDDGTVKALSFTEGRNETDASAATGTAVITAITEDGGIEATITITTTMASQVDVMTLPPLKDQFADYFMIGNIFSSYDAPEATGIANTLITHHYNIVTHENNLKPSYMFSTNAEDGTYTYNTANMEAAMRSIDAAIASGLKVQGHTLLWHSQLPPWQRALRSADDTTSKEDALALMKEFVTYVVTYYKGKIYAWDVLNEVFPDGPSSDWRTAMRDGSSGNPWFVKIGADFVYEGFKAARLADPDAILYYNDYNMDSSGKATVVRNMVRDVNLEWENDLEYYDGRLLIEGIGMQSHHNTGVSASSIRSSLNMFRQLGVRISISELDVLCMSYSSSVDGSFSAADSTATNGGRLSAANLYGQYFQLFLENADIIERVTFWGLHDNMSWRSKGLPLPFEGVPINAFFPPPTIQAKPAYYKMIEALENWQAQ